MRARALSRYFLLVVVVLLGGAAILTIASGNDSDKAASPLLFLSLKAVALLVLFGLYKACIRLYAQNMFPPFVSDYINNCLAKE